ncbi:2-C-methyl-D-erythritol 4-phosphate cytidylyltransferase [Undibacterium umbellatum]|uniref:2-C-methyl-D-erythritol 4-phosphate cytidylyltransferase n=1 Tax=Undibacterium umbellatum TaxID=2762300 RepID=A0ABR6Z3B6_9BURK|nr:2-C-methyl-D-erythritol 4-phosphate cytidylyltransferase [Undibacterium umbellatum]MBC3906089.1 2-C-methyl-D-erythritol 4-phosphate cytidylyltransferase [Undibacterium umbellatum]
MEKQLQELHFDAEKVVDTPRYVALIPAAGVGSRMGATTPKQYMSISGKSVLQYTVDAFLTFSKIQHTYVLVSPDDAYVDEYLAKAENLTVLRCGGASRRDTVRNGLSKLAATLGNKDWVLVHDAARPGLTSGLLQHLIDQVADSAVGGLLALPVVDTVKRVENGKVQTIPRDGLWLAQTPQMFRYQLLCDALDAADQVTDEASAIEAAGHAPIMVEGHVRNMKLTLPSDMALIAQYLNSQPE